MSELKTTYLNYAIQELRKAKRTMAADNADWELEALLAQIECYTSKKSASDRKRDAQKRMAERRQTN